MSQKKTHQQEEVTNNLSFPGEWTTRFMCKSPDTSFRCFSEQAEKTPKKHLLCWQK